MRATLTDELWAAVAPIYTSISTHPFITGLTDGSLPRDRFAFYITQDALYLKAFARSLLALASKAPEDAVEIFGRHATDALNVEHALHQGIVRDLGMHPEQIRNTPMAPTNQAYTDFLLATTLGRPYPEGLAAVLPCYWIYQKVGKALLPKGSPDPLYQRWIATYADEAYDQTVAEVLALTNRLGTSLRPPEREAMSRLFITATRYEWMFWDMAHRRERWPV